MTYNGPDITPGYGIVKQVVGTPGFSADITYICDYWFPFGKLPDVEKQVPVYDRYPVPMEVMPHSVGVGFPAYIVDGTLQMYMGPELPQFRPCASPLISPQGGNLLAVIASMPANQRAALRRLIMEDQR